VGCLANILECTVTWADTTTETVSISDDYKITLGGVTANYLGMNFRALNPTHSTGLKWNFYDAENQIFFNKILAYLQSKGVRILRPQYLYYYPLNAPTNHTYEQEAAAYNTFFDAFLTYKMFIIPTFITSWQPGANAAIKAGTVPDEVIYNMDSDTWDEYFDRHFAQLATYDNVLAICCDNELDYVPAGYDYTAANATTLLNWMIGKVHDNGLLATHNISQVMEHLDIAQAILTLTDIPGIDFYAKSESTMTAMIDSLKSFLGFSGNFWCEEIGYCPNGDPDWTFNHELLTPAILNGAAKRGAVTSWLYQSTDLDDNLQQHFDNYGNPKPHLNAIMNYRQSLEKIGNLIT
jgi:hypothetical protein